MGDDIPGNVLIYTATSSITFLPCNHSKSLMTTNPQTIYKASYLQWRIGGWGWGYTLTILFPTSHLHTHTNTRTRTHADACIHIDELGFEQSWTYRAWK